MTDFQKSVILLIKSALNNTNENIPENLIWKDVIETGNRHQIIPLLYYGAVNSKIQIAQEDKALLENAAFRYLFRDQNQQYQTDTVFKAFEKNEIDYMPLKGTVLKYYYPKTEMRPMSDADILIKPEQYDRIRTVMSGLGFEEKYESDHELVWKKKDIILFELHKRIIPSYNKDYYTYYGDGWRLAKKDDNFGHRYHMSAEDELIYNFTHMAKHYRDGGIGIRHIIDIYVCQAKTVNSDEIYIKNELKKLKLWDFYVNVDKTIKVWFENDTPNEKTDFITDYIFTSGSYGTKERKILSAAVKDSKSTKNTSQVRHKKLFSLIFMPYKSMCVKYHFLSKYPFLLPVMWVVRWISAIFLKKDNVRQQIDNLNTISSENIDDYQQALNYVGLDFNFKE